MAKRKRAKKASRASKPTKPRKASRRSASVQPASGETTRLSDQIDRELARTARDKRTKGQTPTVREQAALRRLEHEAEERLRRYSYQNCPLKDFRELTGGRKTAQIKEQAQRYRLPMGGPTIDLYAWVKSVFDLLRDHAHRFAPQEDDPLLAAGGDSPNLERYRKWAADKKQLEVQQLRGELVARADVRRGLLEIAELLRQSQETLRKSFGDEAAAIVEESLDEAGEHIERSFSVEPRENE